VTADGVDPLELLAVAETAADTVVPRLAASRDRAVGVDTKSTGTDMVTEFDRWSERTLVAAIRDARPLDGFLGEEGASEEGSSGVVWVIDPIDGTTNFLYDLPGYSVSIAARVGDTVVAGLVHDPIRGERFRATIGGGATRDGNTIRVSGKDDLATALVATGFSYDRDRRRAQATVLVDIVPHVRDIRRFGGAALDLCALACGRVDAYYERGLGAWDTAAGALIAAEAGAVVVDHQPAGGAFVGAAPAIAVAFAELLERAGAHAA
jgi:myo-inositol-1(or 4)-monophosphatase